MNLVRHFTPLGYAVCGFDHPGHGRSGGRRVYVERFENYTDTLNTVVESISEMTSDRPVFLIGHSMGGLIAAAYLLDHPTRLSGAVLSGPSVKASESIPAAVIFTGRLLSALLPKVGLIALDASGVSRDPAVVDAYIHDPLVHHGKISARLGAELLDAMRRVTAAAAGIHLPLLILQGAADKLVDPEGTRRFFEAVGSGDKTLEVYEGLYHEVFNEPEHERVLLDVQRWIEARI
jgi:alpha-beta hydrolase superfamily lysophospholipase